MRKWHQLKSIELYREGIKNPWRVSLLRNPSGIVSVEVASPALDVEPVKLVTLTRADYETMVDLMIKAVKPTEIKRSIERGWEM